MITIFIISSFLTAATSVVLGFFVLLSHLRTSRLWFLTTLSIAVWSFALGMEVSSPNYNTAFWWNKFLNLGAIFIPIFYYHFIVSFLDKNKAQRVFIFLGYVFAIILSFFNFFTSLLTKGVPPKAGFPYWVEIGPLYYVFFIFFVSYILYSAILLVRGRRSAEGIKKIQIYYLLIAVIFGAGGGVTNFFPQIFNIYPIGNYLVVLYTIFISYAILKHHLFNIKIIATELITLALFITLLIKTILSGNLQELLVNAGVLASLVLFGILLIRSVIKEVEQREQIEAMAKQVQAAYEVEKKARELEKISREKAENLTKELKKLEESKNQFIMATQHHLRTPLTAMRGYVDLLFGGIYGKIPPKIKEVLTKFNTSTVNEIKVVNELLDISQFQLGKEVVLLQPNVDLEPILKEIVGEIKMEADKKGLYLKIERPKGFLPKAKADPMKLKVALFNVIDNAVKYTKHGGITLSLVTADHTLRLIVKDTGAGISKEEQTDLFSHLFERGKTAQQFHATGRGIGLYLTYNIIKAHHGKMWVESEGKDKGSTFFIEFPIGG